MSHPLRAVRLFATTLLAGTALAQTGPATYRVEDLIVTDWQRRNAAARALAAEERVDVDSLVKVLHLEWNGWLPTYARFGGMGGRRAPSEPRAVELRAAREAVCKAQTSPLSWYHGIERLEDAVVPLHPHELVRLILQRHPDARAQDLPPPDSIERARCWLQLRAPDDAALRRACHDERTAGTLAVALWLQGEAGQSRLRALLPDAETPLRRAALALGVVDLFDREELVDVLVRQLVEDDDLAAQRQAGYLLTRLGARAAAPVARACGDDRSQRSRAAAVLALLGADAAPAAETLVRCVDLDRATRRRALVALASIEVPPELRARAAQACFRAFEEREQSSKLLALDAIGRCGDGVDAAMRARLQAAMKDPPFGGIKARLLGCLRDLGVDSGLTTSEKAYVASTIHPTTTTWLALADDGPAGARELEPLLREGREGVDQEVVVARLAETAPDALRGWLTSSHERVRSHALQGLRTLGERAELSSKRLVELAQLEPGLLPGCIDWLATRADAAEFAPQVLALIDRHSTTYLRSEYERYLKALQLPFAQKVTLFGPLLRKGLALAALGEGDDDGDTELLRRELRRHWQTAEDAERKNLLLSALCRVGLRTEEEIDAALEVLASKQNSAVLLHLDDGPDLPAKLRAELLEMLSGPREDEDPHSTDAWYARRILLAHKGP